jgi:hypothetical protein
MPSSRAELRIEQVDYLNGRFMMLVVLENRDSFSSQLEISECATPKTFLRATHITWPTLLSQIHPRAETLIANVWHVGVSGRRCYKPADVPHGGIGIVRKAALCPASSVTPADLSVTPLATENGTIPTPGVVLGKDYRTVRMSGLSRSSHLDRTCDTSVRRSPTPGDDCAEGHRHGRT